MNATNNQRSVRMLRRSPRPNTWFAWIVLLLLLPVRLTAAEILVFAAASLTDSLREIGDAYTRQQGIRVTYNFGASSLLARQIEAGAPADLFFSAADLTMDALEKKGLLLEGTRRNRLGNVLVVVVAKESGVSVTAVPDLAGEMIRRIALAEPATVPAGIYARAYLMEKELWPRVAGKVVPTENVRAALAAVESGNVDAGIVYKTDAPTSKKVVVAVEIPAADGPRINYPVAALKQSPHREAARAFLAHLLSPPAGEVFAKHGFLVRE